MQLRPLSPPAAIEAPAIQPPVWQGWVENGGAPASAIEVEAQLNLMSYAKEWAPVLFVAWCPGAVLVDWIAVFTPTVWDGDGAVAWEGGAVELALPSSAPGAPGAVSYFVIADELTDGSLGWTWPMSTVIHPETERVCGYIPVMIAAGNALAVSLPSASATVPGVLTASASAGGVALGSVSLALRVDNIPPDW